MRGNDYYIGNTDHDWFELCKGNSPLPQVNFWQPSRKKFHALNDGGIFFFRRKAPINKIGGFGILAFSGDATIKDCWDSFGISNGVDSLEEFITRVRKYRKSDHVDQHTLIGVKTIVEATFLDEQDWFDLPRDWSQNIVTGKGYSADSDAGKQLYKSYIQLKHRERDTTVSNTISGFSDGPQTGYYAERTSKVRVNQSQFRLAVIAAYEGRCAITGCSVHEALDAAHIKRFSDTQDHSIQNGILLRKDIHALIDQGLLIIDKEGFIHLSGSFHDNYSDKNEYLQFEGKRMRFPKNPRYQPRLEDFERS